MSSRIIIHHSCDLLACTGSHTHLYYIYISSLPVGGLGTLQPHSRRYTVSILCHNVLTIHVNHVNHQNQSMSVLVKSSPPSALHTLICLCIASRSLINKCHPCCHPPCNSSCIYIYIYTHIYTHIQIHTSHKIWMREPLTGIFTNSSKDPL